MDQMKNKKRDAQYKQYTLKDYKNLKQEVRLGGLGPNTESQTVKEKVSIRNLEERSVYQFRLLGVDMAKSISCMYG